MAWNGVFEEPTTVPSEGKSRAVVTGIRDMDAPHGPVVRIDFKLSSDDEAENGQVSGLANKRLSENTKLGRFVAAILGRTPNVGDQSVQVSTPMSCSRIGDFRATNGGNRW